MVVLVVVMVVPGEAPDFLMLRRFQREFFFSFEDTVDVAVTVVDASCSCGTACSCDDCSWDGCSGGCSCTSSGFCSCTDDNERKFSTGGCLVSTVTSASSCTEASLTDSSGLSLLESDRKSFFDLDKLVSNIFLSMGTGVNTYQLPS